ncbi:hypothetical protein VKI21_12215 [Cyanobacterium aponinum UTEX 3222]|uniref:hypothetical protein n=1 Tax=Cyanobacterium aponinum TaxID=379064 RepID=UPI00308D006B|nr:hypothetical protein VKI21_12215 [Cyanobacterium aponinum UTEX 3222]
MIINAQIPDALYKQIQIISDQENISIGELVSIALSNQLSSLGKNYLAERAKKVVGKIFKKYLISFLIKNQKSAIASKHKNKFRY